MFHFINEKNLKLQSSKVSFFLLVFVVAVVVSVVEIVVAGLVVSIVAPLSLIV